VIKLDKSKIDNVVVVGVKSWDQPDYIDAYIESASHKGVEMTKDQLKDINQDKDFVMSCVWKRR